MAITTHDELDSETLARTAALRPRTRGLISAIAVGVMAGALGSLLCLALLLFSDEPLYSPLIGAVVLAMWAGGATAGITAIVSGWAIAAWVLAAPRFDLSLGSRDEAVRWGGALGTAIVIAAVAYAMRRGHERTADAADRAERSRLRVERLQELGAALSAALTPEEVARAMVDGVPAAIGARGGALGLLEGDELVIVDPAGARGQTLRPGSRINLASRAPIARAAAVGKPAWAQRRREFVERFPDGAALAPYASGALAVPVFVGDRLAGAMGFPFVEPDSVTEEIRIVARLAADLGGQALERADLYAQERTSREALDRILAVAPRFLRGSTLESVASSVCAEARRAFGCDVAQIWIPIDDRELEVTWRDPPSSVLPAGTRIDFANFPGLMEEMVALRSMFVPNAQEHARGEALRHARELAVFSSLRIPIVIGAEFSRILTLQWHRVIQNPAPSVLAVARRFADQAGLAIEQAERRRAEERSQALQAVTEALAAAVTSSDVARVIVRQGVSALGARAATVYAISDAGDTVELVASEGYDRSVIDAWKTIPIDTSAPVTDAIRTGELIACASYGEIVDRYPWFDDTEDSFIAAPLIAAGRPIGAVFIGSFSDPERMLDDLSVFSNLARQAAQSLERARLFEREQASAGRLRKVQAVTAGLSKAVTLDDVARTCLEHATAGVDATAGVVVLRREGTTKPVVVTSWGDGEGATEVPAAAAAPIAACIRDGMPAVETDWAAFPMASGALALKLRDDTALSPRDRDWLVTLVSQGAQALDRAGRFETERAIAETLQRSVLPERLPAIHGIELAGRYLPGTVGVDVGGDWYDAIQFDDGRVGLVVGDVVGKGVKAAAMMGQLRNAARAFAFEFNDPDEIVARLGRFVDGMHEAPFATLVYLAVEPHTRTVRYVVAGHPPPLVVHPDGTATYLSGGRTLPIGVDATMEVEASEVNLSPGATIVLYTDGLVERRGRSLDEGLDLLAVSATETDRHPEDLVDALVAALLGEAERLDDVALVVLRFSAVVMEDLRLVLPATKRGLVEMRDALRAWLGAARIGEDAATDVLLAAWEACANAVEHAQDPMEPTFTLTAKLDDAGRVWVEVRDSGRWKAGNGEQSDRGLGLGLMRSLMEEVRVLESPGGTTIQMVRGS